MRTILGIDPAWTSSEPSGVALLTETSSGTKCLAVSSSYSEFLALGLEKGVDSNPNWPDPQALLRAARAISGTNASVIAIDIPVQVDEGGAPQIVTCRREADNAISREFGSRWCGTHSPNVQR